MKLPKKARAALAKVQASGRATAVRRAAVDISRDAVIPLAGAGGAGVAALVDGKLESPMVGQSGITKGQAGVAVVGLGLALLFRKNPVVRKVSIGVASGPIAVVTYNKVLAHAL